ncbi:hypothetical protein [Palleronia caenipelagi]|nr:hypothetical protein [Palleronia caenipelagi]
MSLWEFFAFLEGAGPEHGIKPLSGPGGAMSEQRLRELGVEGF